MQVDSPDSFENVASKWVEEISDNCPGVRMVLTALKCDLRRDEDLNDNPNAITFEQGLAKAKEIGAVKYLGNTCVFFPSSRTPGGTGLTLSRMFCRPESWYPRDLW